MTKLPKNGAELCSYIVANAIGFRASEEFRVQWDDYDEFAEVPLLGCASFGRFVRAIVGEAIERPERRAALKPALGSAFDVIEALSTIEDEYIATCVVTGLFEALEDEPADAVFNTIASRLGPTSRAWWDRYVFRPGERPFQPHMVVDLEDGID